jgi:hypothetical protein
MTSFLGCAAKNRDIFGSSPNEPGELAGESRPCPRDTLLDFRQRESPVCGTGLCDIFCLSDAGCRGLSGLVFGAPSCDIFRRCREFCEKPGA